MTSPLPGRVHFAGIGGIGVSSLAQWYLAQGSKISGSDSAQSPILRDLEAKGVLITGAEVPEGTELLVWSQAVPDSDPARREAARRGIPQISYPEAIGELTARYETLAVAGAHGKSTTTAILGLILADGGLDPTVIVGTKLKEFGGNFRAGSGDYLVLEADEYRGAFLNYSPARSIITNIDAEHLDYYRDLDDIKDTFLNYAGRISKSLVLNADDPALASLRDRLRDIGARRGISIEWYSLGDKDAVAVRKALAVPGEHNVSNALGALRMARQMGVSDDVSLRVFGRYAGAWRRMEYRGDWRGAPVYDDYAHHPTEIRATLAALKGKYPGRSLICVFQPHQAERLTKLFREFQTAFADADETLVLPCYQVAGRDSADAAHSAEALVRAIQAAEPKKKLFYLPDPANLVPALEVLGDPAAKTIVMMGAGNIVDLTDRLLG